MVRTFNLVFSVLFCLPSPASLKVVNKAKVRRAGSGNLESRKYGIPFPSFDGAPFSLHFPSTSLRIQWSPGKNSQPELLHPLHPQPSRASVQAALLGVHIIPSPSAHSLDSCSPSVSPYALSKLCQMSFCH